MSFNLIRTEQDFTVRTGNTSELRRSVLSSHDVPSAASEALKRTTEQFATEHPDAAPPNSFVDYFVERIENHGRADEYGNVYRRTRFYIA